jgi:hypothetical protein
MKSFSATIIVLISLLTFTGCTGKRSTKDNSITAADSITVPDTGFTGIKQGMSGRYIVNEITYKNGVRNGLMKTFYESGKLRQTFWFVNGVRQDSAKWYYEEGQVYRSTPYKNDTVDGVQKQYYRTGKIKARLTFIKGLRTQKLEEFKPDGKLVSGYPDLNIKITDEYKSKGLYRINLSLSDNSPDVKYYRGDFSKGVFDTAYYVKIKVVNGIGTLTLKKTKPAGADSVGVIASILTNFGNRYLVYKKIDLPYNDLK